jgi:hypothetical protein
MEAEFPFADLEADEYSVALYLRYRDIYREMLKNSQEHPKGIWQDQLLQRVSARDPETPRTLYHAGAAAWKIS